MPSTIRHLFEELGLALQQHVPCLSVTFAPPATSQQIREAEDKLSLPFPAELSEWLQCANGQLVNWSDKTQMPPRPFIIPQLRYGPGQQDCSAWGYWYGLEDIVTVSHGQFADPGVHSREFGQGLFGPVQDHGRFIHLAGGTDPISLAVDMFPATGGNVGQIVSISDYPGRIAWIAPSLSSLLTRFIDGYRAGKYRLNDLGVLSE